MITMITIRWSQYNSHDAKLTMQCPQSSSHNAIRTPQSAQKILRCNSTIRLYNAILQCNLHDAIRTTVQVKQSNLHDIITRRDPTIESTVNRILPGQQKFPQTDLTQAPRSSQFSNSQATPKASYNRLRGCLDGYVCDSCQRTKAIHLSSATTESSTSLPINLHRPC